MTTLSWLCVVFGITVAVCIFAAIGYDLYAVANDKTTISRFCLESAQRHPWFAAFVAAMLTMPVGILIGHLFFPQEIP